MHAKVIMALALIGTTGAAATGYALFGNNLVKTPEFNRPFSAGATAPTNTRRIWVVNNEVEATGSTNWWSASKLAVHAWVDGGSSVDVSGGTEVVGDSYYNGGFWYIDITLTDATSDIYVIVGQDTESQGEINYGNNNQTFALHLPAFGKGADVIWLQGGVTWDGGNNRNCRNANITTAGFGTYDLALILNGFNTCSNSNTYGYNAYPQLEKSILAACDSATKSSSTSVQDYDYAAYVANGHSYENLPKNSSSTIADKISGLEYWYNYYKAI